MTTPMNALKVIKNNMAESEDGSSSEHGKKNGQFYISRDDSVDNTPVDPSYKHKVLKHTGSSIESEDFDQFESNYAKVLVLYTGGTIGMRSHGGGKVLIQ